uniref:J domain-containing protein n=1 Tax=Lygus hesperus TaxID=30085 RepID=A0A0A9Y008_LYGHE
MSTTTTTTHNVNEEGGCSMGKGNFFAFFDLPKQPDLNVSFLQKCYHNLQRQVHPDQSNVQLNAKQVQASSPGSTVNYAKVGDAEEKEQSKNIQRSDVDVSSYANNGYNTLRDPY